MKMIYYSIAVSILIQFQIDGPRDLVCIFKMTRAKFAGSQIGSFYDFASEQLLPSIIGNINKNSMVVALLPEWRER